MILHHLKNNKLHKDPAYQCNKLIVQMEYQMMTFVINDTGIKEI